jgi:hypothetical protein
MRSLGFGVVCLIGCGHDQPASPIDAPPLVDTAAPNVGFCPVGTTTANIELGSGSTHASYSHMHAGATWFVGPVAPSVAGPDMSASLLFTSSNDPLPATTAMCCAGGDQTCCALEGITVDTTGLGVGAEVGAHPVTIRSFRDPAFQLMGTLTISAFVQPFENAPGRIAGVVSASSNGMTVSGSFDNTFCAALLTTTI